MAKTKDTADKAPAKKAAAKAPAKKTTAANVATTEAISSGFDPKNRLVEMIPGKKYTVRKYDTGFEETGLTKVAAEEVFAQQISCSHN